MQASPSKLPVWRTVKESFALIFRHVGALWRIVRVWLLVMLPVYALAHWAVAKLEPWPFAVIVSIWIMPIIDLPFLASVAVAWHRLVLDGEAVQSRAYLRLDRIVWLYALYSLGLMLLVWGGPLAIWVFSSAFGWLEGWTAFAAILVLPIILLAVILVAPRLSLVLPAHAVERPISLSNALALTRGNTWRMAFATFVVAFFVGLMGWPLLALWGEVAQQSLGVISEIGDSVIASLVYAVLMIAAVGFLSLCYRHFVGDTRAAP